ncbi:MAG: ribosome recycling factor [Lachnospiraceae bacterium]|nr:ribosome recycling factor [Lachnospiraceae bacterium]
MDERISKYETKMEKSLNNLGAEYAAIRAGRANPHILDRVMVDYYGTPTPVAQVGNIAIPEARIITITPWEKNMVKEVIKAIETSDIGINPGTDGSTVRLVFPELSEERRKELSKDVKKKAEECKVAIRNIRRDGNDEFKKLSKTEDMSEDAVKDLQDQLQKITDRYIKKVDEASAAKEKEIMTV